MLQLRFDRELEKKIQIQVRARIRKLKRGKADYFREHLDRISRRPKTLTKGEALEFLLLHQNFNALALRRIAGLLLKVRRRRG